VLAGIMVYAAATTLLIGLAALALERVAAQLLWSRRGIWLAALILSLVLPSVTVLTSRSGGVTSRPEVVTRRSSPTMAAAPIGAPAEPSHSERIGTAGRAAPAPSAPPRESFWPKLPSLNKFLRWMWLLTSVGLLGFYALSWMQLRKASRGWRREILDRQEVWITADLGPAVFGYLKPRVLLPEWVLNTPTDSRASILRHELEHVSACDPLLLLFALAAVAAAPWNIPLWWQLRRLRFAIEVDCDARVVRGGTNVRTYGEVLLTVGQQGTFTTTGMVALTELASHLERRIRILTEPARGRRWSVLAAALGLSCACIATAAELNAPSISSDPVLRELPPTDYASRYSQAAETAARERFPELFQGNFTGSVLVNVGLDRSGSVLGADQQPFPSGGARFLKELGTHFAVAGGWGRAHGFELDDIVQGRTRLIAWFGPENLNKLYLNFDVIKWPHDPARSAERVRAAVAARYPDLLSEARQSHEAGSMRKVITVVMNDDGTISRDDIREVPLLVKNPTAWRQSTGVFVEMGLRLEQLGHQGIIYQGPSLAIEYAWPRHADDPPLDAGSLEEEVYGPPHAARADDSVNQAIMARYFPDVWRNGMARPYRQWLWILFDTQGNILGSGRRLNEDPAIVTTLSDGIEARYPGIRHAHGRASQDRKWNAGAAAAVLVGARFARHRPLQSRHDKASRHPHHRPGVT
jgi:beta-lactamase regulating signal transducer with metallopeptidase domain